MIFAIEISDQADNDLRNIYEYIAFELQSPENASAFTMLISSGDDSSGYSVLRRSVFQKRSDKKDSSIPIPQLGIHK